MITAQWAKGHGGLYCYYRCTKKNGKCTQGYLREEKLVSQVKERLEQIALPDDWIDYMTKKTDEWEKEEKVSSTREKELGRTFAGMDFGYEKSHAIGFKRQFF